MNQYFTKLSFEKLEQFDIHRSNLSTFVLIRNTLIQALTQQQQEYNYEQEIQDQNMLYEEEEEEEEQIWLDSCFNDLEETQNISKEEEENEDEEEDSDEDDLIPLSPEDHIMPFSKKKPTFFINEEDDDEEEVLLCYDIPYLSLNTPQLL